MAKVIFLSLYFPLSRKLSELGKQRATGRARDLLLKEIASRIERGLPPDDDDPEHGPDLRAAGDALLLAAQYNYYNELKWALLRPEWSALLHHTNAKSESLLHIGAKAGHPDVVEVLLDRACDASEEETKRLVQMRSRGGNAALHEAVRSKNLDVVEMIADKGKEMISAANDEGRSPLYIAVEMGFVQGVRTMLDKDRAASRQTGPGGRTLLHAAVSTSNVDIAEILLDQAPSLTGVKDDKGQNSIHYATTCGSLQAVKLLLRKDRSAAYAVDNRRRLPIHLAAIHDLLNNYRVEKMTKMPCKHDLHC